LDALNRSDFPIHLSSPRLIVSLATGGFASIFTVIFRRTTD